MFLLKNFVINNFKEYSYPDRLKTKFYPNKRYTFLPFKTAL